MFLAHLVGDYILQWDKLAFWKGRELKGVLAHGLIVLAATWAISLPIDPGFWPWVLFICGLHVVVDAAPLWIIPAFKLKRDGLFELVRFLIDQAVHVSVIVLALVLSGYLKQETLMGDLGLAIRANRDLVFVMAYVFTAMPAWILVEFMVYGLVNGSAPDFPVVKNYKYVGTLERWLMTTFVVLGQFVLVPLVALPRLMFEGPQVIRSPRTLIYVAELLASVALAVLIGLALRAI
jgi:hypothetical protein